MQVLILLTTVGANVGDWFDLYYTTGFNLWTPFATNVSKTNLTTPPGYTTADVIPDNATHIKICEVETETTVCHSCIELQIFQVPPTTTTTSSSTSSTTTTTTSSSSTTTTTTTIAPPDYYIYMSGEAKDSDVLACAGVGTSFALYMEYPAGLGLGSIVYSDASLTTPYDGNDKWYKMSRYGLGSPWFAVQIHATTGVVDTIVTCV